MRTIVRHIQNNVIAYIALFVALGGTGYAAVYLPRGSVGANQIKNHVIEPVKLNHRYIAGTVRAWAQVNADGTVQASSTKASVQLGSTDQGAGFYLVHWQGVATPNVRGCVSVAGLSGFASSGGSVSTSLQAGPNVRPWNVFVRTWSSQGAFMAQPFYVALLC